MLRVISSKSPIFEMRNNKKGMKKRIIVHVISKLIRFFSNLLMFLILPFLDVHNINGTNIPSIGKNRNVSAEMFRNI